MQLTKNFNLAEFERSDIATRLGLDNTSPSNARENLTQLCVHVLQPLRKACGPIRITSGYRAPALNTAIRGSKNSDHIRGMAADIISAADVPLARLGDYIEENLPFKQLILEHGRWIHISYELGKNREEVLRASLAQTRNWRGKRVNKTIYAPFSFGEMGHSI